MNNQGKLTFRLFLFILLTYIVALAPLGIWNFIIGYQADSAKAITAIIVHLFIAFILHFILDNKGYFLRNSGLANNEITSRIKDIYLKMAISFSVITLLSSIVFSYNVLLGLITSFLLGIYLISNTARNNKPIEHTPTEEPDYCVIHTGDNEDYPRYTSHGSAHWISDRLKNSYADSIDGKPTYKGLWIGGGFFHHKEGNLLSIAPPGTGKGAALIIPNLLWHRNDFPHSFVVFDPKGTNACITARFQKELGKKVIIIDPMNLQGANKAKHGIVASNFNPLDHIKHDIFNGTSQIVNLLIPDDPNGEKFWNQDARNLVQALLMHIMTDEEYSDRRNLITLYKIMLTANFAALLQEMILNPEVDGTISDLASGFADVLTSTEQTFSSIRTVANASIKWLSNPALQNCMKTSDFDPDDLEKGGVALYICQPIQNKEGFATFSRLIIGFCLRANSKPAAKPKAWVYYLLDEFPTMGIFPEVIESLAFSREYKMRIWIFAQSLSQLDSIYKIEGRNQILGNVRVLQAFGVTDHVTQEYISKRIGNSTIRLVTQSHTHGNNTSTSNWTPNGGYNTSSGKSYSSSNNESFHSQPLLSTEKVQYDPHIITISEWGPMRLYRWQYWQNDPHAGYYPEIFGDGRADKNPNIALDSEEIEESETEIKVEVEPTLGPKGDGQFSMN